MYKYNHQIVLDYSFNLQKP